MNFVGRDALIAEYRCWVILAQLIQVNYYFWQTMYLVNLNTEFLWQKWAIAEIKDFLLLKKNVYIYVLQLFLEGIV